METNMIIWEYIMSRERVDAAMGFHRKGNAVEGNHCCDDCQAQDWSESC